MGQEIGFRFAQKRDAALVFRFIKDLAEYEHMSSLVVSTKEMIEEWVFDKKRAEVLFLLVEGKEAGFALFFHNFSTFLGRSGLYLEDLFISPEYRHKGYGKILLRQLATIAVQRDCGRMEWWCLDWHKSSIDFYKSLGAEPMEDWTVYRLTQEKLKKLSECDIPLS